MHKQTPRTDENPELQSYEKMYQIHVYALREKFKQKYNELGFIVSEREIKIYLTVTLVC